MFDDDSFNTQCFSTESYLFDDAAPAPVPLLGVRRKKNNTRENDEALLMMLGQL